MTNLNKVNKGFWWIRTQIFRFKFSGIGRGSVIFSPMQIDNPHTIFIADNVFIAEGAWLMGGTVESGVTLKIDKGTVIGHYSHIIATKDVVIENDVLFADKVFISDCTHNYCDITVPIINQGISFIKPVRIGAESWIGENVCICGANVGKHCVIGANSVVTKDIPDYCVAVGSPAKIIKRYDITEKRWKDV